MTQPEPPTFQIPSPYPAPGAVIDGKYQVERILGEGGMGAVAKATHLLRRAPVALKFISPAVTSMHGAVERFINEAVAASRIDSDHVVKVFDVGQMPTGAPFLVMEYLEGCDLAQLLMQEGRPYLDVARSVHFTLQALRGLQVAHSVGIVHRDMKPSNCFVITKDGEVDFVKLVDFGISKVQQPGQNSGNITRTNSALGTPLYMSPEQARSPRDVDLRTDIYSVAVILYELLTGRTPFHSDSGEFTEILFKIFTMDPPPIQSHRADLPDALCAVIHHALQREPKARFASAAEFADALGPWADSRSAHVLARLRNVQRVSQMPAAPSFEPLKVNVPQSVVPPPLDQRQGSVGVFAQTQGMPNAPVHPFPTQQSHGNPAGTDMAASRDAVRVEPPAPAAGRRSGIVVGALALVAVVAGVSVTAVVMGSKGSAASGPSSTAAPSETVASTPSLPPTKTTPVAPTLETNATSVTTQSSAPPAVSSAPVTTASTRHPVPSATLSGAKTTTTATTTVPDIGFKTKE